MAKKDQIEKLKQNLKPYIFRPELIQELLDEKLMNVATLAGIIGMNQAGIGRILHGTNKPTSDTIGRIAAALGVKPGHFFDRD